jgi:hypothetical protein
MAIPITNSRKLTDCASSMFGRHRLCSHKDDYGTALPHSTNEQMALLISQRFAATCKENVQTHQVFAAGKETK